tara:strand:+ start:1252 stop:1902 length:651 start_codon:yes stop_codon:yes gene_type:complete
LISNIEKILLSIKDMVNETNPTMLDDLQSYKDPFRILISTILSQRAKDEQTFRISQLLFSKYSNVDELSQASEIELHKILKPIGFYRVKSKNIKKVANIIKQKFNGVVPKNFDELISLPSVGRKSANCVLVYAFNKLAIPVDTHVHRVSNRLGLVDTKNPDDTEYKLSEILDKKFWFDVNSDFIRFGKTICKPINPNCQVCKLKDICKWNKLNNFA